MQKVTKVILAVSAAGTLAAFGVGQFVSAQSPSPVTEAIEQDDQDETDEDEDEDDATELQRLATVTLLQAVQTAEQSANAPAFSAELERENNQVIYAVMVGEQEFLIDASNGQVIATETEREAAIALQPLATINAATSGANCRDFSKRSSLRS
ncbi:PepSY domain-containing protein [Microcoleus sp. FACHB-1515]|uniref:PepSY domain-containing protein n=1 Tax=Cyanophyceae TaxID=3028117 RepID=UPI001687B452|nr:PepSY domain-containing protein [Microcoleus sp. FACHB-1515]MBD2093371.1 PepSY domain-containing protein [Microcoleus sp. FACHB-1515]